MPKNNKKKQSTSKKNVEKKDLNQKEQIQEETPVEDASNNDVKGTKKVSKESKKDKKNKVKDKSTKKSWFKDFKAELKKVTWPKRKELFSNTAVVIVMVLLISAIIFVLDLAFDYLNKFEVEQIKKAQNSISVNETVDNAVEENTVTEGNTANETEATETNLVVTENNVEE